LVECSGLESLNWNLLGLNTANEKGTTNSQALVKAANTDWLLWVFGEMTWPTRGRHSFKRLVAVKDSIWDEGSSQERASVWAMRLSISIKKGEEIGKDGWIWEGGSEDGWIWWKWCRWRLNMWRR
jgi:hypothetical protein